MEYGSGAHMQDGFLARKKRSIHLDNGAPEGRSHRSDHYKGLKNQTHNLSKDKGGSYYAKVHFNNGESWR